MLDFEGKRSLALLMDLERKMYPSLDERSDSLEVFNVKHEDDAIGIAKPLSILFLPYTFMACSACSI